MAKKLKAHRLRLTSDEEIKDALQFQQKHSSWNLYLEREFLENTLNQRVNFVIASFALFVTAAATVKQVISFRVVLLTGAILLFVLTITTWRVYIRLDIVLKMLYKTDPKEVLPFVQREVSALKWKALSGMIKWIYFGVPAICTFILTLGFILSLVGWLEPLGKEAAPSSIPCSNN